jgi:hypothetical protein
LVGELKKLENLWNERREGVMPLPFSLGRLIVDPVFFDNTGPLNLLLN